MLWLDGSPPLPFPIISAPFLHKYCLEDLALVDLANLVVWKDNSFLYWDGLISERERLHRCSQVSSQLVDWVSFSTFERACERLLAISKPSNPVPIMTLSPCRNRSVDQRPSSESGAAVTTLSPVLPRHAAAPTETTTSHIMQPPQQPHPAPYELTRDTHTLGAREIAKEGGEETTQAGADGKHQLPPLPVTPDRQQGPTLGPCLHPLQM